LTRIGRARKQPRDGAVAQMGERCNRTAEVRGSIPLSSTRKSWSATVVPKAPKSRDLISVSRVERGLRRPFGGSVHLSRLDAAASLWLQNSGSQSRAGGPCEATSVGDLNASPISE
jgi:hypothetical protein